MHAGQLDRARRTTLTAAAAFLAATAALANAENLPEAAKRGDLAVVRQLLERGTSPDTRDSDGVTALMYAAEAGHAPVVRHLLERGADPNLRDSSYGMTALMVASAEGRTEVVRLLLDAKADVDAKDNNLGATALLGAAEYGHAGVVELLLSNGADANAKDKRGFRALAQAATNGHLETVRLLMTHKADVNAQDDKYGATPLMGAAANGHYAIVQHLLEHGADSKTKDKNGRTALEFARQKGHSKVLELLERAESEKTVARTDAAEDLAKEIYADRKGFFKIRPPRGWQLQEYASDPRGKVAFAAPVAQVDLRILAKAVDIPDYEGLLKSLKDIEKQVGVPMNVEPAVFNGMPAVKRLATISGQGGALKLLWVDLLVNGVSHNLQYAAPPDVFDKYRETAWKSMMTYEPLKRETPASPEEARKHEAAKWLRLAKIAIEMEKPQVAKDAIAAGLEADPENTELKQMRAGLENK